MRAIGRSMPGAPDSKDVFIEGNTFKGFEQKVRVNGDSTYTLK